MPQDSSRAINKSANPASRGKRILLVTFLSLFASLAQAQSSTAPPATIPALFLSDIHFDPMRDPQKAVLLEDAPESQWPSILATPPSPTAAADYAAVNKTCPIQPLVDPDEQLWQSALAAIHEQASAPHSPIRFAVLTGDIVGHQLDCRYNVLFPHRTPTQFRSFVEKTATYVISTLRAALPNIPLYITLGNDDTGCHDNNLTPGEDEFLAFAAKLIAPTLPAADRSAALRDYPHGFYASTLPAPLSHTRILVLDDVYQMDTYRSCNAQPAPTAQNDQLTWLNRQLDLVRSRHQQAWVMAHVPPGVNAYSTFNSKIYNLHIDVCRGGTPISFLSNNELAQVLASHGDVVHLALFGHAHTDELRLLTPNLGLPNLTIASTISGPVHPDQTTPGVAVKILPSISPVFSELPSFTLAQINAHTSDLVDYTVILASNSTGIATTWSPSYTFSEAYHLSSFTPATLAPLIARMQADTTGDSPDSLAYMREYRHYFFSDGSAPLKPLWKQFACSLNRISADAFTTCACTTAAPISTQ